jgi:CHASE1-domain containing sensor protein
MLFGLGLPEWVTIIALIAGLWLTLKMMARASVAYEKARKAREQRSADQANEDEEVSS